MKHLSLEQSKKIAHLFPEHSGYWWFNNILVGNNYITSDYIEDELLGDVPICPAPDIHDLLEVLPHHINTRYLTTHKFRQEYCVCYKRGKAVPNETYVIKHTLLIEALGLMAEKLDKEGLL